MMKNVDLFSRRFLSISMGLTMVLLSASLFVFSLKSVTAAGADPVDHNWSDLNNYPLNPKRIHADTIPGEEEMEGEIRAIQVFGVGIREGNLYFGILYNNNSIGLHKAPADGEDVLDW